MSRILGLTRSWAYTYPNITLHQYSAITQFNVLWDHNRRP
nr:MAG TPA: hypothetical protein [Caudoviricetes sp.]DAN32800.1 MAG TPA: hypothetical protein [Caudoviricetes sp.]DAN93826.1 MAG TPA: hypothetical protein [Caudoviricetes sp.]DAT21304.1 MAG TPA: hypothetical protein [Caudoviricetes sp.]